MIIVSTRAQLDTSPAESGATLKHCEDQGLQERSLNPPKESGIEIVYFSLDVIHRPISGKHFLEMARFEVFAEDEVSDSHAPENRGADILLCLCHSRHISSLGSVTRSSIILRSSKRKCLWILSTRSLTRFIPRVSVGPLQSGLRGKQEFYESRVMFAGFSSSSTRGC